MRQVQRRPLIGFIKSKTESDIFLKRVVVGTILLGIVFWVVIFRI